MSIFTYLYLDCNLFLRRYCQLEEPASYRKEQLYNSLKLHEFYHDAEDELSWIKDRRPIAASKELGHNLTEVQNLLHKHQVRRSYTYVCTYICMFIRIYIHTYVYN